MFDSVVGRVATRTLFRSPLLLSRITIALIALVVVLDLVSIGAYLSQVNMLERATSGQDIGLDEATANDARIQGISALRTLVFLAAGTSFFLWFYRLYKNLGAFVLVPLAFTPGWAVGSFFIPFLNFVRPYQIMREAWSHNAPPEQSERATLVTCWWVGWIGLSIFGWIVTIVTLGAGTDLGRLTTMSWLQITNAGISNVIAVLAILVIWRQTGHQIARVQSDAVASTFG